MQDNNHPVKSVAVFGLGLIGASILKDIQRHAPEVRRLGWSTGKELTIARKDSLVEDIQTVEEVINQADMIIIATPLPTISEVAEQIKSFRHSENGLLTIIEVGSTKSSSSELFKSLSSKTEEFIQTHPMGGSEKTGYNWAHSGIFREKPWVVLLAEDVPVSPTSQERIDWLLSICGAIKRTMATEDHDRVVASISHAILDLSHLLFDFIEQRHPEGLPIAGESFTTTTRLASDNPNMVHSINEMNSKEIGSILNEFADFIKERDITNQPLEYFEDNKLNRDHWLNHRRRK